MSLRFRIAQKTRRIARPALYSSPQIELAAASQEPLSFQPVGVPAQQQIGLLEPPPASVFDSAIDLPATEVVWDFREPLVEEQDTIEIIPAFQRPRVAGRTYIDESDTQTPVSPHPKTTTTDGPRQPYSLVECRHGIAESFCSICRRERVRVRRKVTKTVDVFEQLWFILQPPILSRLAEPDVFPGGRKPYPFQVTGIRWLLEHPHALLADQMGLGKTIQAIIAMRILFRRGELQRVLIVCPLSVANTWATELENWSPELRVQSVSGPQSERSLQWQSHADVLIATYDRLRSDTQSKNVHTGTFDLCIIDEAQYIKNSTTARSRAVKTVRAKYRWALTGTPLENRVEDTQSIFQFILGSDYDEYLGIGQYLDADQLRRKIEPFTLRRRLSDVQLELPTITRQDVWLDLSPQQRTAYNHAEADRRAGHSAARRERYTNSRLCSHQ